MGAALRVDAAALITVEFQPDPISVSRGAGRPDPRLPAFVRCHCRGQFDTDLSQQRDHLAQAKNGRDLS